MHWIVAELLDPLAGWIAVLLLLACPMFRTLSTMTLAQLPLLLYALTAILAWLKWRANGRLRWAGLMGAALGLAMGVLSLTNAAYALTYPVLVTAAALRRGMSGRLVWAATALLFFLLAIAPWTIRNYHTFGRLFYIRDGVKLEMYLGNHPQTAGWVAHAYRELGPAHNEAERSALLNLGETAYFDDCWRRFRENYAADPSSFWTRTACRVVFCVAGKPVHSKPRPNKIMAYAFSGIADDWFNSLLSVLGLAGAVLAWRLRYRCGWVLASGVLAVAPFWITLISPKHLLPWRVVLLFYAVLAVVAPIQRFMDGVWPRPDAGAAPAAAPKSA